MKVLVWTLVVTLISLSGFSTANSIQPLSQLSELKWQYRVLIVAPSTQLDALRKQFRNAKNDIDVRDLVWVILNGEMLETNNSDSISPEMTKALRALLRQQQANVVLIGKDGGVKYRASQLILDDVMAQIDLMPMRQVEMRQRAQLPRK